MRKCTMQMDIIFYVCLLAVEIPMVDYNRQCPAPVKVAVYEHVLIEERSTNLTRREAVVVMMQNLDIYEHQARKAAQQGVKIIVFPEAGLYGTNQSRASVLPYLEFVPDPLYIPEWCPCIFPDLYSSNTDVLHRLSCMAREHNIYLVANIGNNVPCDVNKEGCLYGYHQYNTNVVFDDRGILTARYHKAHLYFEDGFEEAEPEASIFQTSFGTFGVVTCFDALFEKPLITIVTTHNIRNIILTTAWTDSLPLLAAVQYHAALAAGLGVNVLVANLHDPSEKNRHHGSGIYTPAGPAEFYYSETEGQGKLVTAYINANSNILRTSTRQRRFQPSSEETFNAQIRRDTYTFIRLSKASSSLTVCNNRLCCYLNYSMDIKNNDLYAFGAFAGLHKYRKYRGKEKSNYLQVCALVRCAHLTKASCGKVTKEAHTVFQYVEIRGNFSTPYVYPELLLYDEMTSLLTLPPAPLTHPRGSLRVPGPLPHPLLTAALYGRVYEQDRTGNGKGLSTATKPLFAICFILCLIKIRN